MPAPLLPRLIEHLGQSEWAPLEQNVAIQFRHLRLLAEHFFASSPSFSRRLAAAGLRPVDLGEPAGLASLPVLTRRDVQALGPELFSAHVPDGHGDVMEMRTSGSTGEPVVVRATGVTGLFWSAMAMREMSWHRRDLAGRLCVVDARISEYTMCDNWGPPASLLARTGPMLQLPVATGVEQLAAWIGEFSPTFLAIYPSTLAALVAHCRQDGIRFADLRHILTIGETLAPAVRAAAEETFKAALADSYSSQEFGHIALQCPDSGLYHVMAEGLIVEVLTERGTACREGETGRVTITDLHNYATPLVRYDIGDYAEVAGACPCGRGLPALRRIVGRERNLIRMPDGRRCWPVIGFTRCREVAPVRQFQLVQQDREAIEVRLVVERELAPAEEDGLRRLFWQSIGHPFTVSFTYFADRLPPGRSGKFEEFVCQAT